MKKLNTLRMVFAILAIIHTAMPAFATITSNYVYDDLYRLTQVSRSDGTVINYSYDEAGNRTRKVVSSIPSVNGACGSSNGEVFESPPISNLCSAGTPSTSGSWTWDCVGLYSGTTAHCSATYGYLLSVTLSGTGGGSVHSSSTVAGVPSDITCTSGTCSAGYPNLNVVNLSATPNSTSTFTSLSGDGSGSGTTRTVTMDAAKAVTATFNLAPVAKNITTSTPYTSLAAALSDALSGAEIWTLDTQLDGAVTLDKAIILKGGWNATYTGKSGLPTLLNGDLTIQNGNSSGETIEVKGKITVQIGSLLVNGVVAR